MMTNSTIRRAIPQTFSGPVVGRIWIGRKPPSAIDRWDDWPDDVRDRMHALNYATCARLRFTRTTGFTCTTCKAECAPHRNGDACFDAEFYCDDCLIALMRETR